MISLKVRLPLFLFVNILFCSFTAQAEPLIMECIVKDSVLNIRETPELKSTIITSAPKNAKVKVLDIDEKNEYYNVSYSGKKGWASKRQLESPLYSDGNYKLSSIIGTSKEYGLLKNTFKTASNGIYKLFLDNRNGKITLVVYNENDDYVKNIPFFYYWLNDKNALSDIVLCIDDENNIYTNSSAKNILSKYDFNGIKLGEIKFDNSANIKDIKFYDNQIYVLDNGTKNIKVFNQKLLNTTNIFLSESVNPQKIDINKNTFYVLDYPEKEDQFYQVYYVDSLSSSFKSAPDYSADDVESLNKGTILKKDEAIKEIKTKSLQDNNPSKVKEVTWIDFSEKIKKKYIDSKDLKKINFIGKINTYKLSGEFKETISLNNRFNLVNTDKHKSFFSTDITRKILSISVTSENKFVLSILSKTKNSNNGIINLYYLDNNEKNYKISNPISYSETFDVCMSQKNAYIVNNKGFIDIFDANGLEKTNLGRSRSINFNFPENIFITNNRLYVLDKGNFSLGQYDLNGEAYKIKYNIQNTDNYNIVSAFNHKNEIFILKTIESEEKKLGVEIYNEDLTKIFDKWLLSLDYNTNPKMTINDKGEWLIYGAGSNSGKKFVLNMFNKYGHILYKWKTESDFIKMYPEDFVKKIRENDFKFLNFDTEGNAYLLVSFRTGEYKIQKLNIKNDGTAKILKVFDTDIFNEVLIYEENGEKKAKKEFSGAPNGDILAIAEGKNNFTYFLFKHKFSKEVALNIYDPTGKFYKEIKLNEYTSVNSFFLDEQDNVFLTDVSSIKKLSNN